ncbi:MAG: ester cyclase [Solirubrobacteraceae bacterium]|nr:ester cyclase [Solirubrobacteraceae bacterium]
MATTDEPAKPTRVSKAATARVARAYLRAISEHDLAAAAACWAPGGRETIHGQVETTAPDGIVAYFSAILDAIPDLRLEELSCTAEADRCTIRSRMTGTFAGTGRLQGVKPNGARIDLEIVDNLVVRDGRIVANDAYLDGLTLARQIGVLPPDGSPAQQAITRAVNARTRLAATGVSGLEKVADGVWRMRGGLPAKDFNVYLLEEADGVTLFDGGIRAMANAVAKAGARLGGIKRVVLGHAHPDHRGVAARLGVPVLCHEADRADAEGDGGVRYFHLDRLNPLARRVYPTLLRRWDGGPVPIAGTVAEGDEIAGFRVVHLPGHAPGMIALFREEDRVALTSDAFYVLDVETGRPRPPRLPHPAFNHDTDQARASLRKLAALAPAAAWPGHLGPLTGDVRAQLEQAAGT